MRKGGHRCSKAEYQQRILVIYRALKDFVPRTEMRKRFSVEFGVTERMVDKYIDAAYKHLREDWDIQRVDLSCRIFGAYEKVLQKGMSTNQLNAALGALHGMARISKIDPATQPK